MQGLSGILQRRVLLEWWMELIRIFEEFEGVWQGEWVNRVFAVKMDKEWFPRVKVGDGVKKEGRRGGRDIL